jgi:preprotein translocase subunit SecD
MNRRRLWTSLLGSVIVVVVLLAVNLALGNRPILGLDLQGGVSVILSPTEGAEAEDLLVIRDLVRDELEQRGIAEPDVRVEGSNLVVDLPGVKDQQDALDAVDVAGIVTLRPVLACVDEGVTSTSVPGSTPSSATTTPGTGTATSDTTAAPGSTGSTGSTGTGAASTSPGTVPPVSAPPSGAAGESRIVAAPSTTVAPASTAPPSTPTTTPTASSTPTGSTVPGSTVPGSTLPVSQPSDGSEVLPVASGGFCQVGPAGGTGEVFNRNGATTDLIQGGWGVRADLSGEGEAVWNALASQCFSRAATCPSQRLAIVLDGVVQSAPVVEAENFQGAVTISGSFTEDEARSLTRVLNRGAFPVPVEAQSVETVSPTLGSDSLRAAVIAGLIGVVLVLIYMVIFYRSLTVLVFAGMTVWGMLIYSVAALISEMTNFALTLAGVTGIIISVGVTVDSYVVYFERMKDEARHGRTLKNSAERSFTATWRTIVSADLVAMIGAAVLFVLSVGSVRGFALYLGVTTACDLLVCYFFTRPAVILLAATGRLDRVDPFGLRTAVTEQSSPEVAT